MPVKFAHFLSLLSLVLLLTLAAPFAATAQDETEDAAAETTEALPAVEDAAAEDEELSGYAAFDAWFAENVNGFLNKVLFFPIGAEDAEDEQGNVIVRSMPFVVIVLFLGGFFFTFRYGFVNIRMLRHSIDVIRGKFDDPEDRGEISHFKALTSALSATVGLGNIAGHEDVGAHSSRSRVGCQRTSGIPSRRHRQRVLRPGRANRLTALRRQLRSEQRVSGRRRPAGAAPAR